MGDVTGLLPKEQTIRKSTLEKGMGAGGNGTLQSLGLDHPYGVGLAKLQQGDWGQLQWEGKTT